MAPPMRGTGTRRGASGNGSGKSAPTTNQVWVLKDGAPFAVPVTVGVSDGRRTEVGGAALQVGAEVITDQLEQAEK
jgi:HlyD family secretion protein